MEWGYVVSAHERAMEWRNVKVVRERVVEWQNVKVVCERAMGWGNAETTNVRQAEQVWVGRVLVEWVGNDENQSEDHRWVVWMAVVGGLLQGVEVGVERRVSFSSVKLLAEKGS